MKINFVVIFLFVYILKDLVLTLNVKLNNLEENLVYSHLKNQINLKLFYEKLIESNGIEDQIGIRQKMTNEDIQQGNIENKVKIYRKSL